MTQLAIIIRLVFPISLIFLVACSGNFYNPKIEKGIFSKKEKNYKSKKIRIITGDTIKSISRKYSISIKEIIRFNKLEPPYVLKPGNDLLLPQYQKSQFGNYANC